MKYTDEQLQMYLERIDYKGSLEPTLETLAALQWAHLTHVPYENIDMINDVALPVTAEGIFEKVVGRKRGGTCTQIQGSFKDLLETLGYEVQQRVCRFVNAPGFPRMRMHRLVVVKIGDKRYVPDVGVRSESCRKPLELVEGLVQTDGFCEYKYEIDDFFGWTLWQKMPGKDWKPMHGFADEPQIDLDYEYISFFYENSPKSPDNKTLILSIFTEDANITVVKNVLKVFKDGKIAEKRLIETDDEARAIIRDIYGMEVPDHYRFIFPVEELEWPAENIKPDKIH